MAFPTWLYTLKSLLENHQSQRTGRRRASRRSATGRLASEQLEVRLVLSATFGGAASIGNADGTVAFDVATDADGNSYMTGWFAGTVDFDEAVTHDGNTDILTARGSSDAYVAKYAAPDALGHESLVWVQRMGGDDTHGDVGWNIAVDGSGNVYVGGTFWGTGADFGLISPGIPRTLDSVGDRDGFVAKLDAGGTIQWATRIGTVGYDYIEGLGVDASGYVYTLSKSSNLYSVSKFDSTGNPAPVWTKSIATFSLAPGSGDLAVSSSGNVFVTGSFSGVVPGGRTDFDPSPTKTYYVSGNGGFALKLDTNGNFGWVSPFVAQTNTSTTSNSANAPSVALDSSGNVIVGGSYYGSVDFNPGTGKGQVTNLPTFGGGYITKLNSSGGLVWARALESSSQTSLYITSVYGLSVDTAGSIYATGVFQGTVDFNPGAASAPQTSAGGNDIFVVKLTSAGNYSWAYTFGGAGNDVGHGIAVDPATGNVHLAGFYEGTVDFDPDPLATYYLTTPPGIYKAFRLWLRQV